MTAEMLAADGPTRLGSPSRRRVDPSRMARALARDGLGMLGLALVVPVLAVGLVVDTHVLGFLAVAAVSFLVLDRAATRLRTTLRGSTVALLRLGSAAAFVVVSSVAGPDATTRPLVMLLVPIVTAAAMVSVRAATIVGVGGLALALVPVATSGPLSMFERERAVLLVATGVLTAITTRQTMRSLERALERARAARRRERRRATQVVGVEEIGRWLAQTDGDSRAVTGLIDLLATRFGFRHLSIYLGDRSVMRLAGQRGYASPLASFGPDVGVLGRVMRTGRSAFVPDVALDPDYVRAADPALSLISVPLVTRDEIIGVINVESRPPDALDRDDLATVSLVADRLASALALARERRTLARRASSFEQLTTFARLMTTSLTPERIPAIAATAVQSVIECETATLTVRSAASGEFEIAAVSGREERPSAARVRLVARLSRRAITSRAVVVEDSARSGELPRALRAGGAGSAYAAMAAPLIVDDEVIGSLSLARSLPVGPFDALEQELLPLVASQLALALASARLQAAATEASMRDALTGLLNRRGLDLLMARLSARRERDSPESQRPISLILFDLDHFGRVNKDFGHPVGDAILQRFADVLRLGFRATDLVARYGGEEFVVILDGATRDEAVARAEDVRKKAATVPVITPGGQRVVVSVSAGCAALEPGDGALESMLVSADAALAMAKAAGRNLVVAA